MSRAHQARQYVLLPDAPFPASGLSKRPEQSEGSTHMADLAYALLLIGVFVLLALGVRGLEKL
ncbi:hypothetical protein ABZ816_09235 [Actinosynnema sp. NPDC047251]|nr:hypothetical protein [Saccharothrix espanaensis]